MLPPLTSLGVNANGQKSLTGGVESLVGALEPFKDWDSGDLAEWLEGTRIHRETGVFPEPTKSKSGRGRAGTTPKPPKPPKKTTAEVVESLRELQGRSGDIDPSRVKAEVDALSGMTVAQLKEVHKEFLSVVVGKTKPELLNAIRKRINDHRASRDRVDGILAQ